MLTFCTLFDSNYMDKGLVLYESLKNVAEEFKLYILAMDERCCSVLRHMDLKNVIVISLEEFEDEELLEIKKKRARAEYCWTCTASLIDYVFETYKEEYCTYIDSDLYFYKNPKVLIQEMCDYGCSVQIVKHNFGTSKKALEKEKRSGEYCVEFNTFKNDKYGRKILSGWKRQCRDHCSLAPGELGDQKYLSSWPETYESVHVLKNQGGGVAPWNVSRFRYFNKKNKQLLDKQSKEKFDLIFYHFHHLEYLNEKCVNINVFKENLFVNKELVLDLYIPYLKKLEDVKTMLQREYGFTPLIVKHPGLSDAKNKKRASIKDILRRVRAKVIYLNGKKKDIINL